MSKRYHYTNGAGMVGCLYDYGPNTFPGKRAAIDDLVWLVYDACLEGRMTTRQVRKMRSDLHNYGIHYFVLQARQAVGFDYCEITRHDGSMPRDDHG